MIRNLTRGTSNFDPDKWNPSMASKFNSANGDASSAPGSVIKTAQPGNKMQVNLTFVNATASLIMFEVWNFLNSFTRAQKLAYQVGNYLYIPQDSYEGIKAIAAGTDQTVGFDKAGDLIVRGLLADPKATLSCKEVAYAGFFQSSGIAAFQVAYMRYKASVDAQIDEVIEYFQDTFSGGSTKNTIDPRAYQKPTNFIETLIDITVSYSIGIDTGIRMKVQAGQSVKLALFIVGWTLQGLNS